MAGESDRQWYEKDSVYEASVEDTAKDSAYVSLLNFYFDEYRGE